MQQQSYLKCPCEACGGNIEFPAQAAGQSIPCPHCSKNTKLRHMHEQPIAAAGRSRFRPAILIVLIGSMLGTAMAIGILAGKKSAESSEPAKTIPATEKDVVIEPEERISKNKRGAKANAKSVTQSRDSAIQSNGFESGAISLEKTDGSRLVYAIGTIHNKTDRQRFGVKVELSLFDEQNTKLGSATDYVQVIEPKAAWKFKALVTEPKTVRVEVASIKEN